MVHYVTALSCNKNSKYSFEGLIGTIIWLQMHSCMSVCVFCEGGYGVTAADREPDFRQVKRS